MAGITIYNDVLDWRVAMMVCVIKNTKATGRILISMFAIGIIFPIYSALLHYEWLHFHLG